MLPLFKKKNKFFLSRRKRLRAIEQEDSKQKFGFSLKAPIAMARNIPKQYSGALFGRPFRKIHFSFTQIGIGLLLMVVVAYLMFFSSLFKIKKIEIVNNKVLIADDVAHFLEDRNIKEKNIFLLNVNQTRDILKQYYRRIDDVRIYKVVPNKLKIKIQEKPSTILWQIEDRKYLIDTQGYVLGEATPNETSMPVVKDEAKIPVHEKDRIVTKAFINFVNTVDESLKKRVGLGVDGYSIDQTTFELKAHINSGFYLVFDTTKDPAEQLDKLMKVYEKGEIIREYVILSIEGKVIVK
ncbi:MAG: FtsQ-type POTRA domain-containing protein [Patescibacteria group bacterium]